MPRRKRVFPNRKKVRLDDRFQNELVMKFIMKVMLHGKKSKAMHIVYKALDMLAEKQKMEHMEVFDLVMEKITPQVEVRSRRIGGGNYQIPTEISDSRKISLALRWLVKFARLRGGADMAKKLFFEMQDALGDAGQTFKKKEDTHRMAEANRALSHYARF